MRGSKTALMVGVAVSALSWGPAIAQTQPALEPVGSSYFERNNNVSVRQRANPLDPQGIPAGSFRFYPELFLGIGYNDNAFTEDSNEEASTVGIGTASADLVSNWGRHALNIYGEVSATEYFEADQANTWSYSAGFDGRLDMSRAAAAVVAGNYLSAREPMSQNPSEGLLEPVEYEQVGATLGYQAAFNRMQLASQVGILDSDYDDARLFTGAFADQDFRDYRSVNATLRSDLAITYDTSVFLELTGTGIDYDGAGTQPSRDGEEYGFAVGTDLDISNLVRGSASVGAFSRQFDSAAYEDFSGLSVDVGLEWFISPLLTANLSASRNVAESGIQDASSTTQTILLVGADYELRRNIILSGSAGYTDINFKGIDREDTRWMLNSGLDIKINRWSAAVLDLSYITQTSSGTFPGRDYDQVQGTVGVRLFR